MEFSHEEVRRTAELAKLDLTDAEIELFAEQLSACLEYFERLQTLDTTDIAPTASVLPLKNVLRDDVAGQALAPEDVVANAPDSRDNQFRVSADCNAQVSDCVCK